MVTHSPVWGPDKLGPDYEAATIDLGADPDGEGNVVTTPVHYAPPPAAARRFPSTATRRRSARSATRFAIISRRR